MWSCKFAIELKYVRFNNKRKIELTDMVCYRLLLCTYTNTMGNLTCIHMLFFLLAENLSDYVTTSYINKMLTKVNYSFLYVVMQICNRIKICKIQ